MAITFVGSNTPPGGAGGVKIDGTNVSFNLPASSPGDLVLVISGCSDNSAGPPSTAGYTLVFDQTAPIGGERLCIYRKFMGTTPDLQVTVTGTGNTKHLGCMALIFRGVNTTTPIDVAVTTAYTPSPMVANPPAITPASNDCCIVIAAVANVVDTSVGSVSNYLPTPSVQISSSGGTSNVISAAASYRILSGGASTAEDPLAWSTWTATGWLSATIALRPLTASVDLVTVNQATITRTGKTVTVLETIPVSKASVGYTGRTVNIPDGLLDSIFVDAAHITRIGQSVEPTEIVRSVTVIQAAVLCRGRTVTPRDIQFEDIPRYAVRGRASGHWMETR
jgi:hypothetical protein